MLDRNHINFVSDGIYTIGKILEDLLPFCQRTIVLALRLQKENLNYPVEGDKLPWTKSTSLIPK